MGDDTYVGNFTFEGRESMRGGCSLGAGLIETPGCMGDYCHIPVRPFLGPIFAVLTALSRVCVGIHRRRVALSPVCA